jgi:hypothetical protein
MPVQVEHRVAAQHQRGIADLGRDYLRLGGGQPPDAGSRIRRVDRRLVDAADDHLGRDASPA